jgi:hypothetical protein
MNRVWWVSVHVRLWEKGHKLMLTLFCGKGKQWRYWLLIVEYTSIEM